jgi:TonB family protein
MSDQLGGPAQVLHAMIADMRTIAGVLFIATTTAALQFTPARRLSGVAPPIPPPTVVSWLEETIEIPVDASGLVSAVRMLHGNTASSPLLEPAIATWRFRPAREGNRPVRSHVLVAALIRPPQLLDEPTLGTEPASFALASEEVPFPTVVHRPRYPPRATGDAAVVVEVRVDVNGRVRAAAILEGATPFSEEALLTARQWVFRPARYIGQLVPAYAYLVFGFRQPA